MRRWIYLYTLLGLFMTVFLSACFNGFKGYLKEESERLLCDESRDYNGGFCCKSPSPVAVVPYSTSDMGRWAPNKTTKVRMNKLPSSDGNKIITCAKTQVRSPELITAAAIREGFITIAIQFLNFLVAKCLQFRFIPPLHSGPSTFWLVFAPFIVFMYPLYVISLLVSKQ